MLQELTLKNFKIFDEAGVTINPGLLTVLVGPNGTGKSTLLQALVLLRQSVGGAGLILQPPDHQRLADFGEFEDLVHLHDISRNLEVQVTVSYAGCHLPDGTSPALPVDGSIIYRIGRSEDWTHAHMEQRIGDEGHHLYGETRWNSTKVTPEIIQVRGAGRLHLDIDSKVAQMIRLGSPQFDHPRPEGADQQLQRLREELTPLIEGMNSLLQKVQLVPAMRGLANRGYGPPQPYEGVGTSLPADRPETLARSVTNVVARKPQLRFRLGDRLTKIFERRDLKVSLRQVGNGHAVQVDESGRATNIVDEAFGLNQLVAPVLWLSLVEEGSVVGVEEPELHLHPKAQTALCEIFVEVAIREQKQIILTTHSEHIVMGLLTAVARGDLRPDQLAIYELRHEGETAKAERLEVNEFGQVKGGLHSFLEADIEQLNKFISAQVRGGAE